MKRSILALLLFVSPLVSLADTPRLAISENGRSLQAGGKPFFWLGDTGWLMLSRLDRAETEQYLRTRKEQGFNVVQVMILHKPGMKTRYGAAALVDGDPARPRVTPGSDPGVNGQYDFWDHLDWAAGLAERLGIYLALVPAWGTIADDGVLNPENAAVYGRFLGERYRSRPNIVWLNGGDTWGAENTPTWSVLGRTLKRYDPLHLMTFHPRGRTASSWWFHRAPWLDFNMYQSGHKSYAQDPDAIGEDNWLYAGQSWALDPARPFLDGEPSYENIPQGLHEASAPRWQAADVRRYAWWSVLSGAAGHTYGENSVMQMLVPGRDEPAYQADRKWDEALQSPGAGQMHHLKDLMLSLPFDTRQPAAGLVVDNGEGHDRVAVLRGAGFLVAYTYTGRPFTLDLAPVPGRFSANWLSPRDGQRIEIGTVDEASEARFEPPGGPAPGNDWVLVLSASSATGK